LTEKEINSIYGDAGDRYFLSELPLGKVKLIISTIPDESVNKTIAEHLKETNKNCTFIATTEQPRAAFDLYAEGIDYVIIPHHLGGNYLASIIEKFKTNKKLYLKLASEHRKELWKGKQDSNYT
jgi:Trk K+ transport system NAD-binding subunit